MAAAWPACSSTACSMRFLARARAAWHWRGGPHRSGPMRMKRMMSLTAERVAAGLIRSATCRAQRGKWCAQWGKIEGKVHSCAHISREVSAAPANSGTAVLVVMRFMRQSTGVMPNSRAEKSHLGSWPFFEVERTSVANLDPLRSPRAPPPGPERDRGVDIAREEEADSSRTQLVGGRPQRCRGRSCGGLICGNTV